MPTDKTTGDLPPTASVIVIGAGLSGLVAARGLVRSGVDVVVVEAQAHTGGRVRSFERPNGTTLQRGGEFTGPIQSELQKLGAEFGIASEQFPFLLPENAGSFVRIDGNGERRVEEFPLASEPEALEDYMRGVHDFDELVKEVPAVEPWTAARAIELDNRSLGTWIDEHVEHPAARKALSNGFYALGPVYGVSLLYALGFMAQYGGLEGFEASFLERFVGGSAQIPERLAEELSDRIHLSAPVRRIEHGRDGVTITTDRGSIAAEAVIVAIEPGQAEAIEFEPRLPISRSLLQSRWLAGHGTKFFAVYDTPFWRADGLCGLAGGAPVSDMVMDVSPTDGSEGILLSMFFYGIDRAQDFDDILSDDARIEEATLSALETYFGPRAREPKEFHVFTWGGDRWSQGCGSQVPPGVLTGAGPALREPVGRIHWAGNDSGEMDYMEGAVRAGQRAATEVSAVIARVRAIVNPSEGAEDA